MEEGNVSTCELCKREGVITTRHHVIPRRVHKIKWFKKKYTREEMNHTIDLCTACHKQIHIFFDHKALARDFNSVEKLLSDGRVKKFVDWIKKR